MADTELVNVVDPGNELLEVFASFLFFKSLILNNQLKELSTLNKLHDKI